MSSPSKHITRDQEHRDGVFGLLLRFEVAERGKNFHTEDSWCVLRVGSYIFRSPSRTAAIQAFNDRLREEQERSWTAHAEALTLGYSRALASLTPRPLTTVEALRKEIDSVRDLADDINYFGAQTLADLAETVLNEKGL